MPSFPLRVLVTPNETLPGRLNWSLVVMDSCKRGEEFKVLRGQDGRIACQTDRQLAKYKYTSGDVLIPVGMIDNRHYSILRAVALSAGIEHKIGWTTLDWVNDILQALGAAGVQLTMTTKEALQRAWVRQTKTLSESINA